MLFSKEGDVDRKSHGQACPIATALDVVGDRWTFLLLRELLGGAARFHQLQNGLPGIAKNLLSSRLGRLEEDGLVRRARAGNVTLYALTELGASIRPTLEQLAFWGARVARVGPAEHQRSIRCVGMALQAILGRAGAALPRDNAVIDLDVDGASLEIVLGRRPTVSARATTDADARLRIPASALHADLSGRGLDLGVLFQVSGDAAARTSLLRALDVSDG
jgi:DNA-binding HxlR family transcriptional regulator